MIKQDWISVSLQDASITLYASKLAAVAGMHRYTPQSELRGRFLKACGIATDYQDPREIAKKCLSEMPLAKRQRIHEIMSTKTTDTVVVQNQMHALATLVQETNDSKELIDMVRSAVYTNMGSRKESTVRKTCNESKDMDLKFTPCRVVTSSKDPWFTLYIGEGTTPFEVYLAGKHDGITEDKTTIVEIKTRQNKFLGVPTYELVQLHAYMHIFNVRKSKLVENYNIENRVHDVPFDDEFWNDVKQNSIMFLDSLLTECADKLII